MGDNHSSVQMDKFEPSRVNKSEIIYHDGDDDDVLYDYGIHKSGKVINPAGHWLNDGFNETRRLPEDVFREQIGIEKIGNAENWREQINAKISGAKRQLEENPEMNKAAVQKLRIAELTREIGGKKRKVEVLQND